MQAVEVRPSNRAVVHHAVVFLREPNSRWLAGAKTGVAFAPEVSSPQERSDQYRRRRQRHPHHLHSGHGPGQLAARPSQTDQGRHATSFFRFITPPMAPPERIKPPSAWSSPSSLRGRKLFRSARPTASFKIPAGDADYSAQATFTVRTPMTLVNLFPHLHLRGKAFQYDVIYPDGRTDTILKVDKWSLNWQLSYTLAEPLALPAGTRIRATAWWDNSANNPANPDPSAEVSWGEQSWEEMLVGFMNVAVDPNAQTRGFQR